jgi:alpha,alpha-trehalose phosphorylase
VHGALLAVEVSAVGADYRLLEGERLALSHRGAALELSVARPHIRMEDPA